MIPALFGYNYTRMRLLKNTQSDVMRQYFQTPFPDKKSLIRNLGIVSLDFETTGLNVSSDRIVSAGWVHIDQAGIDLKSCYHRLIGAGGGLPEASVVIHQITDNQLTEGLNIEVMLSVLLKHLRGKVLLVHNAKIEMGFIKKMCRQFYNTDFVIPVIDTQYLAMRSYERQNIPYKDNELRLFNLRKSFNMPVYKAHNALMDAISTAELFLAMAARISPGNNARLGEFLSW